MSSSSSLNANIHNNAAKSSLKQEFLNLAESFDKKCNELNEIRKRLRELVDEMSSSI